MIFDVAGTEERIQKDFADMAAKISEAITTQEISPSKERKELLIEISKLTRQLRDKANAVHIL